MKLRGVLFLLSLLLSVPAFAQVSHSEVNSAPHIKIEAQLPNSHPSVVYLYAARLFKENRKDEAVFWFYVGQLRYRYHLAANPELSPDKDPAVMASLNATVGQMINEWAGADPIAWARAMDRALDWDASHDNSTTPKKSHQAALQQTRTGLAELRDTVIAKASEIRSQRKAAGLPVR